MGDVARNLESLLLHKLLRRFCIHHKFCSTARILSRKGEAGLLADFYVVLL
jgi:hypothetical protein